MELILWHEPARVTHAHAAARARLLPRPRAAATHSWSTLDDGGPGTALSPATAPAGALGAAALSRTAGGQAEPPAPHAAVVPAPHAAVAPAAHTVVPQAADAAVAPAPHAADAAVAPAAHAAISEISVEVADFVIGSDAASYVWLRAKDSAVPNIRYLAGKHRLVCFDPQWQAVLNPPLLRRSGAFELSFCIGHTIDDPARQHLERAIRELTPQNWFVVLEDGDDHYVQAALTSDGYLLEVRDGSADKHLQTRVSSGERVIEAFVAQAGGGSGWRDGFEWVSWH